MGPNRNIKREFTYDRISSKVIDLIRESGLKPGEAILSEQKLAKMFNVSYVSVRRAIGQLVEKGVLTREHGRGTFLTGNPNGPPPALRNVGFRGWPASGFHPFFTIRDEVLSDELIRAGCRVLLYSPEVHRGKALLDAVGRDQIHGVVLVGVRRSEVEMLVNEKIPILNTTSWVEEDAGATAKRAPEDEDFHSVVLDLRGDAALVAEYLIQQGHRKIALADANEGLALSGLREAMEQHSIRVRSDFLFRRSDSASFEAWGYQLAQQLADASDRPDAIYLTDDGIAKGFLQGLGDKGMRPPEGIVAVALASPLSEFPSVCSLATLEVDPERAGRVAAQVMLRLMSGEAAEEKCTLVGGKIVVRTGVRRSGSAPRRARSRTY